MEPLAPRKTCPEPFQSQVEVFRGPGGGATTKCFREVRWGRRESHAKKGIAREGAKARRIEGFEGDGCGSNTPTGKCPVGHLISAVLFADSRLRVRFPDSFRIESEGSQIAPFAVSQPLAGGDEMLLSGNDSEGNRTRRREGAKNQRIRGCWVRFQHPHRKVFRRIGGSRCSLRGFAASRAFP